VCNLVLWENAEHAMVGFKFGKLKKTERWSRLFLLRALKSKLLNLKLLLYLSLGT
jgi:hypothetical protein